MVLCKARFVGESPGRVREKTKTDGELESSLELGACCLLQCVIFFTVRCCAKDCSKVPLCNAFDHSFPSVVRYCVVLCKDCSGILLCSVFWSQFSLGSDVAVFCHNSCMMFSHYRC